MHFKIFTILKEILDMQYKTIKSGHRYAVIDNKISEIDKVNGSDMQYRTMKSVKDRK